MAQISNNKQQHLFELLKEDQEPFFLKDYIADRRCQLKRTNNNNNKALDLHFKKRPTKPKPKPKPKSNNITTTIITHQKLLCQKASCFYSSSSSPDLTKSPLFEFPSPISIKRSPCKRSPTTTNTSSSSSSNPILLHIPARTAALLLEAALRIQKQSKPKPKPKAQILGLFGSLLKRLTTSHSRTNSTTTTKKIGQKLTTDDDKHRVDHDHDAGFDCPRPSSSGVWSETSCCNNSEDKSLESSSSSSSQTASSRVDFVSNLDIGGFCDEIISSDEFCGQSPFRFVLQRSRSSSSTSSSGRRTPEFSSPAGSPARHRGKLEGQENYSGENSRGFQEEEEEEEEEKEQFSPVSVLDPPFEDVYEGHDDDHDDQDQDGFDMESSFAIVQRTKQQLLQKLRRFERLAELDPIELEKRMLEQDDDEDSVEIEDHESINASDEEVHINHDDFVREVLSKLSYHRAPRHMKRLVSDLVVEERGGRNSVLCNRDEEIVKGVVKRFESWKEVQSNTIDMMVEQDFRNELQGIWKSNDKEQIGETALEIEFSIFGLLIDELAQELVF